MTLRRATLLAVLASLSALVQAGHEWSYQGEHGVDHWVQMGFSDCAKHRQSPIAIDANAALRRRYKPMEFYNFGEIPTAMNITNNLHSAGATMLTDNKPYVRSGGLPGDFEVIGFHFHWGEDNTKGSEHTINERHFPLEMHVVCKNMKYQNMKDALSNADGLAVLAVLFEVSETNNRAIGRLEESLGQISEGGSTAVVEEPPRLLELMPWNTNDFYRYDGSLTTPSCNEVVTWTIFLETVKATEKELNLFRSLKRGDRPIGPNYRTTQDRYGRQIYLSYPETEEDFSDDLGPTKAARSHQKGDAAAVAGSLATVLLLCAAVISS